MSQRHFQHGKALLLSEGREVIDKPRLDKGVSCDVELIPY